MEGASFHIPICLQGGENEEMTKQQFLKELRIRLSDLPYLDQKRSVDYYSEIIDDRIEDGLSEEDAVKKVGTPAMAAAQILSEMPITTLARARVNTSRSALATALIIIGSPIWISLLAVAFSLIVTAFAVLFAFLAVFLSLIITLWAVEFSFAAGALGGIAGGVFILFAQQNVILTLLLCGAGLVLFTLAVLGYYAALHGTKGLICLCGYILAAYKGICRFIKFCLIRKESIR